MPRDCKKRKIQIAKNHDNSDSNDSNDILDLNNEVNTDDEVEWVDKDEAKQLFLVLTKNMKELKLSKRPSSSYNFGNGSFGDNGSGVDFGGGSFSGNFGGSSFDGRDGSNSSFFGEDGSNSDSSNNDSSNDNSNDDKIIKNAQFNALINIIEDKLKLENKYLTPEYKLRLKAIQHYLQLLNKEHAILKANQTITDLLNREI
ncbi:4789_t:CDS:2 [Funneliformis caledonium]|uniref:4789_t:CDS:1 n=1 Tax=Funneliformis caledonium TaxID=1117310 RepID=A0A9N9BYX0_9GLOM|nr:4789_t:CDS:2 [Funneliformis caledonium]